jgi:hypothetical protein
MTFFLYIFRSFKCLEIFTKWMFKHQIMVELKNLSDIFGHEFRDLRALLEIGIYMWFIYWFHQEYVYRGCLDAAKSISDLRDWCVHIQFSSIYDFWSGSLVIGLGCLHRCCSWWFAYCAELQLCVFAFNRSLAFWTIWRIFC